MATERQPPDAILESNNLTGGLSDIDDDPDTPDGNWMVATGNNTNIDVRVSFATPTGNPTIGADLQEFKAWVRQYDEAQSGTPDCRLELWENGVLVRAGSDTAVPTGGLLLSFTWNANELVKDDGSSVECKIVGTKTGGSPSTRNTVDVGAVEWNVTYTVEVIEWLAGIANGVAAVSGLAKRNREVVGSVACSTNVSGVGKITRKIAGVVNGIASVSGLTKASRKIAGAISSVASVVGDLTVTAGEVIEWLAGIINGTSQVSGGVKVSKKFAGLTEGVTSLTSSLTIVGEAILRKLRLITKTRADLHIECGFKKPLHISCKTKRNLNIKPDLAGGG